MMNQIVKRILAGTSAVILSLSAVGPDTFFTNVFTNTVSAEGTTLRSGRSTGFPNLEQDTDNDGNYYNTGYGLHTNKTAEVAEDSADGRTFDVNLESWYVGENPVDVATILDASGSMAWTVDTLDPLVVDYDSLEKSYDELKAIQDANGGYLPQDVVDKILDPENTDNSKLSYADYQYYVYESRSSVSEFVPLGYWDGGCPGLEGIDVIGYYPFDNSLKNELGGEGKLIKRASDGSIFTEDALEPVEATPTYKDSYLDLSKTTKSGAILLDVVPTSNKFTIEFTIKPDKNSMEEGEYDTTPILYVGNTGDGANFFEIARGDEIKKSDGSYTNNTARLRIYDNKGSNVFANAADSSGKGSGTINPVFNNTNAVKCTFTFDFENYSITYKDDNNNKSEVIRYIASEKFPTLDNLRIIVGGNGNNSTDITKLYLKDLTVKDSEEKIIGKYSLDGGDDSLKNTASDATDSAMFIEQANSSNFVEEQAMVSIDAAYSDKTLNLTKTAKNGAVLLDARPKDDTYTLSFKIMKTNKSESDNNKNNGVLELLYIGELDPNEHHFRFTRNWKVDSDNGINDSRHLRMYDQNSFTINDYKAPMGTLNYSFNGNWHTITIVVNGTTMNLYDGDGTGDKGTVENINISSNSNPYIILAGILDEYKGNDVFIDDLFVYDTALTAEQVKAIYGKSATDTRYDSTDTGKYHWHAVTSGNEPIAQIDEELSKTPAPLRRGWYYVNSHSEWKDISDCLEGGKQYVGIKKETDDGEKAYSHYGNATIPSSYTEEQKTTITDGDEALMEYIPLTTERSIRFYVDSQNHLRCFVCAGGTSKDGDPRTFCSVVYEKGEDADGNKRKTKYEELNNALNSFYSGLARNSDLSNSAIVRFSTHNLLKNKSSDDALKELIIKDWTNWSDYYQKLSPEEKTEMTEEKLETLKNEYMKDLLIPAEGETSKSTTESAARPKEIEEYPYVMTGGTYTWTGLKAFYDNMVKTEGAADDGTDLKSGDTVYDIANDARDKYLIIFTDGRDNTVGDDGDDYVSDNKPNGSGSITEENQLAEAWANKLKDEGYTIFCVMMAAGSISPIANPGEYNRAKTFVTSLAGGKETTDEEAAEYVSVIGAGAGESGEENSLEKAFADILTKIQQPHDDYIVQDYIDPRFDLIDGSGNVLKLGAGGVITDSAGNEYHVGNFIDDQTAIGYPYTPIAFENVTDSVTKTNTGTGTIYYDNVKDMYYLRWENQTIPMASEAFNTDDSSDPKKYLDVWSATIRLKAKDDFIGGNNILTNGNEAGENLVYSNATIKNMDKGDNYKLYGFSNTDLDSVTKKIPYRKKLEILSGTNRKINAVDAGGVSQAVYGNGIDIPSSGFPRTIVDVKLLQLNAKNLNDVIYMGEVVSPTMMLASLENDYMTDSYYLEYLERYAYRIYGNSAGGMPLIELLNKWLKINLEEVAEKTFTIPYIYLPDPEYEDDKLVYDGDKVKIQNSTGWDSDLRGATNFADPNLRDITGFITYTWKRGEGNTEEQQKVTIEGSEKYDITKEYVVKDTNQIVYNLQLKFTPLKEGNLDGFTLDKNFIEADSTVTGAISEKGDSFFNITGDGDNKEFSSDGVTGWSIEFNRADYLKAMVKEQHTYKEYVNYDTDKRTWKLSESTAEETTDNGVYDWDSGYKPVAGSVQIESEKINGYYTNTPQNVKLVDAGGAEVTDTTGAFMSGKSAGDVCSLVANTTYIKDIVNGALALELVVDGKYLQSDSPINKGKTYTFEATRYYDDPLDPLPYGEHENKNADTGKTDETSGKVGGKKYQLTFEVDEKTLPKDPQANQFYTVWATLTNVEVFDETKYVPIKGNDTPTNPYTGYAVENALPIGTYEITSDSTQNRLNSEQFKIADSSTTEADDKFFEYLKIDNVPENYAYDKFPKEVYEVSKNAAEDTKDNQYLIWNGTTDNSPKNVAESNRTKVADKQTATFYFGTVKDTNAKGTAKGYVKDRLGIILLSADNNSLAISKTVTNVEEGSSFLTRYWTFTITFEPDGDADNIEDFKSKNEEPGAGFALTWYTLDKDGKWELDSTIHTDTPSIGFEKPNGGNYTATLTLKHDERVLISGLPEGKWQVTETDERKVTVGGGEGIFYSAHNNMDDKDDFEFSNVTSERNLNPNSYVDFVNEFPRALPSTGGAGIDITLYCGIMLVVSAGLYFAMFFYKKVKRREG